MRWLLAGAVVFVLAMAFEPTPAEAYWYFKNNCAWSITSTCAQKRVAGKVRGPASTAFGRTPS
jgi:hypothetical protein